MPTYRPDLDRISPYVPGRSEADILAAYGLERVIKLASNESPVGPFPEVVEAIAAEAANLNRYPDTTYQELGKALADHLDVPADHLWFGGGGAELLFTIGLTVAGPGSSVVYPHPSFVMYRIATAVGGAQAIEVPLDGDHRHDIDGMIDAVRPDTRLVFVCNPNNPTGTHVPTAEVARLIDAIPPSVLVVIDEAYHHYVAAADYRTMIPEAVDRDNVVVVHTFSKVYGLAGLRVGYAVGRPEVLTELRRTQLPFTVTSLAQVAALTALRHTDRLAARIEANAAGRARLQAGLAERGIATADSQTNFVMARLHPDPAAMTEGLLRRGVIVRPTGTPWLRVTVGAPEENEAFLSALDDAIQELSSG